MVKSGIFLVLGFVVMMTGNLLLMITVIPALQVTPTANAGLDMASFGVLTAAIGYLIMLLDVYGNRIKPLQVYRPRRAPGAI
jgi:hypothetical protein